MARISELHYSDAYSRSSGVAEFLEVALRPVENPADFVVGFYNSDGTLGIEVTLTDPGVSFSIDADNGEHIYVISADDFPILLTDPDSTNATIYEAYALTNTNTNTVIDFYDIGGGVQNIVALSGAAAAAAAPGSAVSTNIATPTTPSSATYSIQFNQPNPNTADTTMGVTPGDTGPACFVAGTLIRTETGERPIESIKPGDLVWTKDAGLQPVSWVGCVTVKGYGSNAPVAIGRGQFGAVEDILVSPQHRILITGWRAELLFGETEVLVPAKALIDDRHVRCVPCARVTYCHLLFDQHQIVESSGLLSESFLPQRFGIDGWSDAMRQELLSLFGGLADYPLSRKSVPVQLGRLLACS